MPFNICVSILFFCHSDTQRKVCLHSTLVQMVMAVMGMGGISHCGLLATDNEGLPACCSCVFIVLRLFFSAKLNSCLSV